MGVFQELHFHGICWLLFSLCDVPYVQLTLNGTRSVHIMCTYVQYITLNL